MSQKRIGDLLTASVTAHAAQAAAEGATALALKSYTDAQGAEHAADSLVGSADSGLTVAVASVGILIDAAAGKAYTIGKDGKMAEGTFATPDTSVEVANVAPVAPAAPVTATVDPATPPGN